MPNSQAYLGGHVSAAGGMLKILERAQAIQANTVQIFAANPRGWQGQPISEKEAKLFLSRKQEFNVEHLVIHAIYLVNLASPKAEIRRKSLTALKRDLISAARLQATFIVLHPGSDLGEAKGIDHLISNLLKLKPLIPRGCKILLEGMAGARNSLGDLLTLKKVLQIVGKQKYGVCLDTAHLFAAGYNLRTSSGMTNLLGVIKQTVGIKTIGCIHLNDSKHACGSRRDHHENLGSGKIGQQGLVRFLSIPAFQQCPIIMETPGFNEQGPDLKNMQRLKKYVQRALMLTSTGSLA